MGLGILVRYDLANSTSAMDRRMAKKLSAEGLCTIRSGTVAYRDDDGVHIRNPHHTGTTFILFKDLI